MLSNNTLQKLPKIAISIDLKVAKHGQMNIPAGKLENYYPRILESDWLIYTEMWLVSLK